MSYSHTCNFLNLTDAKSRDLCDSCSTMKALKSKLTKQILSDPKGEHQLRVFLASKKNWTPSRSAADGKFIVGRVKAVRIDCCRTHL